MKSDYTLAELRRLPTLCVGQADDLKIDDGRRRVWISRCGEGISIEKLKNGKWELEVNEK